MPDTTAERIRRNCEAVRRSAEVHRDTITRRDEVILAASDAGWTTGQIARVGELHKTTVHEIIANTAATRAAIPTDPNPGGQ